jgi:Glutamine synthetase, beta-Grasp domain
MFQTYEQARNFLDEQSIQMVDFKFTDLWGRWHHLTVPASQFSPQLLENGIGFDGSAVGLKSVKAGDMVLVPDLSTGIRDPFWEAPTLSFICTTLEADTHAVFTNDPRNIAIRAEEFLQSTGIADESRWGPEFEFYILIASLMNMGSTAPATAWIARKLIGPACRVVMGITSPFMGVTMPFRPRINFITCAPRSACTFRPWVCRSSTTTMKWAGQVSRRSKPP